MSEPISNELIHEVQEQFEGNTLPGVKNDLNYEDLRHALAAYLHMLMKENRDYLYARLYRIDVSEKDVKMAMSQNLPHYLLAELILQKLNQKLFWRNKYKNEK
jgi:D-mannonate dehydratase